MDKNSLQTLLESPAFVDKILNRLLKDQSHHILKYPRVKYSLNPSEDEQIIMRDFFKEETFKKDEWFNLCWFFADKDPNAFFTQEQIESLISREDVINGYGEDFILECGFHRRDSFLTGAAVSAVIYEELHGVPAVINDVDVFYYQLKTKTEENIKKEIYENLVDSSFNYRIVKNRRRGLLNFVKIYPDQNFCFMDILNSFDLNYCKVGVVLGTKRIIFEDCFLDFLINKRIEIHNPLVEEFDYTVFNTFIRGAVKAKDFNCNFYLGDYARRFLSLNLELFLEKNRVLSVVNKKEDHNGIHLPKDGNPFSLFITKTKFEKWEHDPFLLSPYFSIEEGNVKIKLPDDPWVRFFDKYINSRFNIQSGLEWGHTSFSMKSHLSPLINYPFYDKLLKLKKPLFDKLEVLIESNLINDRFCFYTLSQVEYKNITNVFEDKEMIEGRDFSFPFVDLFKESFSFNKLKRLKSFMVQHGNLRSIAEHAVGQYKFKISEVIELFLEIQKLNLETVGFIESNFRYIPYGLSGEITTKLRNVQEEVYVRKNFKNACLNLKKIQMELVKEETLGTPLRLAPFSSWVREITLKKDLQKEGSYMRHCVGGYSLKVKRGECRIFHLKIREFESTLEVGILTGKKGTRYQIIQHKASSNRQPHSLNITVAKHMVSWLNNGFHL